MVKEVLESVEDLKGQEKIDAIGKINKREAGKMTFKQKLPAYFMFASFAFLAFMLCL